MLFNTIITVVLLDKNEDSLDKHQKKNLTPVQYDNRS